MADAPQPGLTLSFRRGLTQSLNRVRDADRSRVAVVCYVVGALMYVLALVNLIPVPAAHMVAIPLGFVGVIADLRHRWRT
jgi:precorrin isomerase